MVGRGFQIRWQEETGWLHSFTHFGIYMQKKNVPETPNIEIKSIKIPGANRTLKQIKEYGPRPIKIECKIIERHRAETKRLLIDLAKKLSKEVVLRFDDKPDLIYFADMDSHLDIEEVISMGAFTLSFICLDGFRYSVENAGELTWESEMTWENDIYLDEYPNEFQNIISPISVTLNNAGTHTAYPIIEMKGTCDVIHISCNGVTTSYGPVNGNEIIVIDTKECSITKEYNGNVANALLDWSGDFVFLTPGLNEVQITGTNLNISSLKFDYKHTFL